MYYPRAMRQSVLDASSQFPVVLLTGPRQVGKTTLLRHLCEKGRRYATLDDPALRTLAREDPGLFLQRFEPPVLIDEIQYAPELLPLIKMSADTSHRTGMFWLTGSQQVQMMRGISETLAGRVAILNLLGFSIRERRQLPLDIAPFLPTRDRLREREASIAEFGLAKVYQAIWLGAFPALIAGPVKNRDLFYSSYLQTYLQRDVKDLAQVGNEAAFLRFLKACAARTAQMLSLTELARDADISVNTAKNWLSILQTSCQVELLQSYHTSATKRLLKTPKLYFLDTGLCAYLAEWSSAETLATGAMAGAMLETFVFAEILKSWWHQGKRPQVYYYRDKDGKEIDLVFLQDGTFYPLEIRKSASPQREWGRTFSVLDRFKRGWAEGGIICLCREMLPLSEKVTAIPVRLL